MKKYSNYKIINDVWIDAVPEHWEVNSLKYFVEIINGYAFKSEDYSDDEGVPIIRIGDISYPVDVSNAKKATPKNLNELDRFIIKKGDLLLAMTGATIGKNCLYDSNEIAYVNQRVGLLRSKNALAQNFLKYYIDTPLFREFISLTCSGSAQENISASQISGIKFPLPSIAEQSQIARYLDHQTSLIDEIINRKEKQIELLKEKRQATINETVTKGLNPDAKMKDSGIEWLGEIPEHWRLSKVKYEFYLKARVGWKGLTSDEFEEESYAYLVTGTDFKQRNINWKTCYQVNKERYEDDPFIILKNGDLLITKDGTIGKTSIVKDLDKPACLNSGIFVLRPLKNNVNNEFLYWIMNSSSFSIFNDLTSTGATIKHLYQNVFQEFSISIPHIEEQNEIVEYLDKQTAFVDNIIEQTVYQITKIKEYRQSIISEAVTGKIDVRDWQPNNA